MRIVLLGAAGNIGAAIARDLCDTVDEVVVADLDFQAAQALAEKLGANALPARVDVTDSASLAGVLAGAQACINSVNYYFNPEVMRGCLHARVPYLDLGGLFFTTRKQLELHESYQEAGLTAVLGLGSCPGISNLQAGYLTQMLDSVESVRIYDGSTPDERDSLGWTHSFETFLDEISTPAMIFRQGEFLEIPPLSEEEFFLFPEPIGYAKTCACVHSEIATLPRTLKDKGIQECLFKVTNFGCSEEAIDKLIFLTELGLARSDPVQVNNTGISPREVLIALLKQSPLHRQSSQNGGFKDIATVVRGERDGTPVTLRMDTWVRPDRDTEISVGRLMAACPAALVGRWLAGRELEQPGVWPPEDIIDRDRFFKGITAQGMESKLTETTPLSTSRPQSIED